MSDNDSNQDDNNLPVSLGVLNDYIHAPTAGLWFALAGIIVFAISLLVWIANTGVPIIELLFN